MVKNILPAIHSDNSHPWPQCRNSILPRIYINTNNVHRQENNASPPSPMQSDRIFMHLTLSAHFFRIAAVMPTVASSSAPPPAPRQQKKAQQPFHHCAPYPSGHRLHLFPYRPQKTARRRPPHLYSGTCIPRSSAAILRITGLLLLFSMQTSASCTPRAPRSSAGPWAH